MTESKGVLGLWGATGVGVGAIVGGGILALSGIAFSVTGPSALLAFSLNGFIAFLTALSFAELSSTFAQSGGTYAFSKKVLSVKAAFAVGWIVWFASIVAAVLYAYGFASFLWAGLDSLCQNFGIPLPSWLGRGWSIACLSIGATLLYTLSLLRKAAGGGKFVNISKVVIFALLILGGFWVLRNQSFSDVRLSMSPFFPMGVLGLGQAMGYTFIALQGFDLIAAGAGDVREPARIVPRAMLYSLGIALAIYLPLLFVVAVVGIPEGMTPMEAGQAYPETLLAIAARNYLGAVGYWLVIVAGVFSMLSALYANLYAASRVSAAMAGDRTLPFRISKLSLRFGTPVRAVWISAFGVIIILMVIPNLAAAGAAASLIFLLSFALTQIICILARVRDRNLERPFKVPFFPYLPVIGSALCIGLALFQSITVPVAGLITLVWLAIGAILYVFLFGRRAQFFDALQEANDPRILQLRGRSPLVLVPVSNPASASSLIEVAHALAPPKIGRVLLLSIVPSPDRWVVERYQKRVHDAHSVLLKSLEASTQTGVYPEALTTVAGDVWGEIARVSKLHRCEVLLMGMSPLKGQDLDPRVAQLMNQIPADAVILGAPPDWRLSSARNVLIPVGGVEIHGELRARLLGSLSRTGLREITFLGIISPDASRETEELVKRRLARLANDAVAENTRTVLMKSNNVVTAVLQHAALNDLLIMGLQRSRIGDRVFGKIPLEIIRNNPGAMILISQKGRSTSSGK